MKRIKAGLVVLLVVVLGAAATAGYQGAVQRLTAFGHAAADGIRPA